MATWWCGKLSQSNVENTEKSRKEGCHIRPCSSSSSIINSRTSYINELISSYPFPLYRNTSLASIRDRYELVRYEGLSIQEKGMGDQRGRKKNKRESGTSCTGSGSLCTIYDIHGRTSISVYRTSVLSLSFLLFSFSSCFSFFHHSLFSLSLVFRSFLLISIIFSSLSARTQSAKRLLT